MNVRIPSLKRKPLKENASKAGVASAAAAAIMTLGGSPTIDATPPVSDRIASASNGGTGLISNLLQILKVTGAIMMIAVTLSMTRDSNVVKVPSRTINLQGSPLLILEALIATYSKNPHNSKIEAKIIIPSNRPITSHSIHPNIVCSSV